MPKIYFIPRAVAKAIKDPVNLISIYDPHNGAESFSVKHNVLSLGFINHYGGISEHAAKKLISEEQIQKIIDFYKAHKNEDIYVHCGEGSVRSPAIATFISVMCADEGNFRGASGTYGGHRGSDHHMCRHTLNACRDYYEAKLMEGEELLDMHQLSEVLKENGLDMERISIMRNFQGRRLSCGYRFVKREVLEKISSMKAVLEVANTMTGVNMRSLQSAEPTTRIDNSVPGFTSESTVDSAEVGRPRIHPRDPLLGGIISESTKDSADYYSPEMVRALAQERAAIDNPTPRLINTGIKDCSVGGCERCNKEQK